VTRVLAVDWGERRIGVALSDESQILAQPLATLTRRAGLRNLDAYAHHPYYSRPSETPSSRPAGSAVELGNINTLIALVNKLTQYDKRVFVVGGRAFTSTILQKTCHEFISYESMLDDSRPSRPRHERHQSQQHQPVVPIAPPALAVEGGATALPVPLASSPTGPVQTGQAGNVRPPREQNQQQRPHQRNKRHQRQNDRTPLVHIHRVPIQTM